MEDTWLLLFSAVKKSCVLFIKMESGWLGILYSLRWVRSTMDWGMLLKSSLGWADGSTEKERWEEEEVALSVSGVALER